MHPRVDQGDRGRSVGPWSGKGHGPYGVRPITVPKAVWGEFHRESLPSGSAGAKLYIILLAESLIIRSDFSSNLRLSFSNAGRNPAVIYEQRHCRYRQLADSDYELADIFGSMHHVLCWWLPALRASISTCLPRSSTRGKPRIHPGCFMTKQSYASYALERGVSTKMQRSTARLSVVLYSA